MKPIYAENIIVAIKSCGCVEWYILDKEYCFLDYPKLEEAYRKKGYNDTFDDDSRFGIKVVNELSKTQFLDHIKEYKITDTLYKKIEYFTTDYSLKNVASIYTLKLVIDIDIE